MSDDWVPPRETRCSEESRSKGGDGEKIMGCVT